MLTHIESKNGVADWKFTVPNTYLCRTIVCEDHEGGGYYAYATRLPGVVGQGDTFIEAVENIKEAFAAALSCYLSNGEIPWQEVELSESGTPVYVEVTVSAD